MPSKKIIAITAVLILLVASVAAISFGFKGSSEDSGKNALGCRLVIYGNANNDDYLDQKDYEFIEGIIENNNWDKEKNPYADVNNDGKVNSDDLTYLKGIFDRKECKLYYTNTWNEADYIHYPFTGNIGTMYWEQADLTILLGLWDKVTACGSVSYTETKNPGWQDRFSYGLGADVDAETIMKSHKPVSEGGAGVDIVIAYTSSDGSVQELRNAVRGADLDMDILCLPADYIVKVLTAGFILNASDRAEEYVKIADESIGYAKEKLKDVDDAPSVLVVMVKPSSTTGEIRVLANGPTPNGLYRYMQMTPVNIINPPNANAYSDYVDIDWINMKNPDWIVFCGSGLYSTDKPDSVVQSEFEEWSEKLFSSTNAYKNGNIISTNNGTMASFPGPFAFLSLISPIFDEIDPEYAQSMYDRWVDEDFALYEFEEMPTFKIRHLGAS